MSTPPARSARTVSMQSVMLVPCSSAVLVARWMVTPSASGSLKGTPSSTMLAPPAIAARHQCGGLCQGGVAHRQVGDEAGLPFGVQRAEPLRDPRHRLGLVLPQVDNDVKIAGRVP